MTAPRRQPSTPLRQAPEFDRLWRGFMTARSTLALMLLLFQVTLHQLGQLHAPVLLWVCGGYFVAALLARLALRPRPLHADEPQRWLQTIGIDVAAFTVLQFMQGQLINYAPLFVLPVLQAAVLGPLLPALGTAAAISLLLLAQAVWHVLRVPADAAPYYIQAALTGAGCFVVAALAHQLAARLASEERRAMHHQLAAHLQQQINALVIQSMTEGILVVDADGTVHVMNPAAQAMLLREGQALPPPFSLAVQTEWHALLALAQHSLAQGRVAHEDIVIQQRAEGPRRISVHTRLAAPAAHGQTQLCVLFLQDRRELEARMRTEKLASMGRMSAAVAHEIRNPLAAIVQSNELLAEDLPADSPLQRLTRMIQQNARRLEKIVADVLDLARAQRPVAPVATLELNHETRLICQDWARPHHDSTGHAIGNDNQLLLDLSDAPLEIHFDAEHLRRILVNLLDNARRHARHGAQTIQVSTQMSPQGAVLLSVWSHGAPLEPSVERHLFEPFFSSESRSSGLGLYICRELSDSHGAMIGYRRSARPVQGQPVEGNDFFVSLRWARGTAGPDPLPPAP